MRNGAVPAVVVPGACSFSSTEAAPAANCSGSVHCQPWPAKANGSRITSCTRRLPPPAADRYAGGTGCRRSVPAGPGQRRGGQSPRTPGGAVLRHRHRVTHLAVDIQREAADLLAIGQGNSSPSSTRRFGLWNSRMIRVWAMPAWTSPSMRACRSWTACSAAGAISSGVAACVGEIGGDCAPAGQAARASNNTMQQRAKTMTGLQWDRGPLNAPAAVTGLGDPGDGGD